MVQALHRSFLTLRLLAPVNLVLALTPPAAHAQAPMSVYWPNGDGWEWHYDQRYDDYPTGDTIQNQVRLFFDGTTVAPSAIAAQRLITEVSGAGGGTAPKDGAPNTITSPLLRTLWRARPDLRQAILEKSESRSGPCPIYATPGVYTVLLGGDYAYEKNAEEIVAWRCNAADLRAWRWLVADLTLGNTFSLQLVPDLADDVFLYAMVAAVEDVNVPAGHYAECLRIDYRIDYGLSICTDQTGHPTGELAAETSGFIHYAPAIGPIQSYEEFWVTTTAGVCSGLDPEGDGELQASAGWKLTSVTPPAPVHSSTWGRIKAEYLDR